jgi:hypothetical protein
MPSTNPEIDPQEREARRHEAVGLLDEMVRACRDLALARDAARARVAHLENRVVVFRGGPHWKGRLIGSPPGEVLHNLYAEVANQEAQRLVAEYATWAGWLAAFAGRLLVTEAKGEALDPNALSWTEPTRRPTSTEWLPPELPNIHAGEGRLGIADLDEMVGRAQSAVDHAISAGLELEELQAEWREKSAEWLAEEGIDDESPHCEPPEHMIDYVDGLEREESELVTRLVEYGGAVLAALHQVDHLRQLQARERQPRRRRGNSPVSA